MLETQQYLRSGKTLEDLEREFAISANHHPSLPLVILNYCQIDSPKSHPYVMECRSLVLEKNTWNIVSRAFPRFFNFQELTEVTEKFNWNDYRAYEKCDGSLLQLFYYKDKWMVITRNSWADGFMTECDFTWAELFWKTLGKTQEELDNTLDMEFTHVFELCSPYNQVVTKHKEPKLYLLDVVFLRRNTFFFGSNIDTHNVCVDTIANKLGVNRPKRLSIGIKEPFHLKEYVNSLSNQDEGLVTQDPTGMRLKIKNLAWLALHRLAGNNLFLYRDMYDLVIIGETSEIIANFPAAEPKCLLLEALISETKKKLMELWPKIKDLGTQKEFALALLAEELPLGWVLFECRRHSLSVENVFRLPNYAEKIKRSILELVREVSNAET